ncbi:sodium-dependent proline transporter-like [Ornithodoros turicata]|uniref:sodium-dependent proline transporter-like n=1 Tax=Ornithodoros turicata TaxID=34597 RepID=UPI003139C5AC
MAMAQQADRDHWANRAEFILSCIGMSVGLGNVWRFPYVVYDNGGGAFMIPYFALMVLVGRPMYYLELILGQFSSSAQVEAFGGFPMARGLGWAMVYGCTCISMYYNIILAYALLYLYYSCWHTLPWSVCDYEKWADENCFVQRPGMFPCTRVVEMLIRDYEHKNIQGNDTVLVSDKEKSVTVPREALDLMNSECTNATQSAPEQFFYKHVLGLSPSIEQLGSLQWQLVVALVVAWACVYLCVYKGIHTSGKVVYVTAVAPFIILGVMFVRGITLPGAMTGLHFYFVPEWSKVLDFHVWRNAAEQIFYSLSISEGMIICFGGFNEFRNELRRDVFIIAAADTFLSIFGGIVVFSVLGNMAQELGVPVSEVVSDGFSLAFVAYPQALSMIHYPNFWSVAFFAMLFFLAIDSEFAAVECVLTPFKDKFPSLKQHSSKLSFLACVGMCIFGLPMTLQGGLYILTILDVFVGGQMLAWIGATEILVVVFGYGLNRFCLDVEFMMGDPPGTFIRFCWMVCCPLCLGTIVLSSFGTWTDITIGEYTFPLWASVVGILSALVAMGIAAVFAIRHIVICKYNFHKAMETVEKWGPRNPEDNKDYVEFMKAHGYEETSKGILTLGKTPHDEGPQKGHAEDVKDAPEKEGSPLPLQGVPKMV